MKEIFIWRKRELITLGDQHSNLTQRQTFIYTINNTIKHATITFIIFLFPICQQCIYPKGTLDWLINSWIRLPIKTMERVWNRERIGIKLQEYHEMLQVHLPWDPIWKVSYYKTNKYLQYTTTGKKHGEISDFKHSWPLKFESIYLVVFWEQQLVL